MMLAPGRFIRVSQGRDTPLFDIERNGCPLLELRKYEFFVVP